MVTSNEEHRNSAPLRQIIANQRKELRRLNKMLNLIRMGALAAQKMSNDKNFDRVDSVWDNKRAMHSFIRPREM